MMGKDRKPLGVLAVVAIATLLISAVVAGDALAGKPGSADATGATLTVSPNPAPLGTTSVTVSGANFRPSTDVVVGVRGWFGGVWLKTDDKGSFLTTYQGDFSMAGTYPFEADGRKGQRTVMLAEAVLTVCSTNPCQ